MPEFKSSSEHRQVKDSVIKAGVIALEWFKKDPEYWEKDDGSLISKADIEINNSKFYFNILKNGSNGLAECYIRDEFTTSDLTSLIELTAKNIDLTHRFSGILQIQLLKNYSLIFLFIGLMSDRNIIDHPLPRFILQFVFLISFILIADLKINRINLDFFDILLSIDIFNIFFTGLCLIILINGSNFLDGLNSLVSGYFLIVSICIYLLCNKLNSNFDILGLQILIIALIIFSQNTPGLTSSIEEGEGMVF